MRLSDVLSKPINKEYVQVDVFLKNKLKCGKNKKIDIGVIALPFYCKKCEDIITFSSGNEDINCIGVTNKSISIDTVLRCPRCNASVPIWYLIDSDEKNSIFSQNPYVKILKRTYKLSNGVLLNDDKYGIYTELIEKSKRAYNDELGAGAIIYLRKIYEQIVAKTAKAVNISNLTEKGKRKNFKNFLKEVDEKSLIVPKEFSNDKYRLFSELSNVIHGEYDEKQALEKYPAFLRLIEGILDNIRNNKELNKAIEILKWSEMGEKKNA